MQFEGWDDGSVLEAASWRLASELVRRHPGRVRLIRGHPGGGLSDLLWLLEEGEVDDGGDIRLNRNGTIQILGRFDGNESDWEPTGWDVYLKSDPRVFLKQLEAAAGLSAPKPIPASTPISLTLRVLATMAAMTAKMPNPIEIESGYFDTSGYGGGVNDTAFESFAQIPRGLRETQESDGKFVPEQRFWFAKRGEEFVLALEQSNGFSWSPRRSEPLDLMREYKAAGRDTFALTLRLLADN